VNDILSNAHGFYPWFMEHRDELDAVVFDVDGVLMRGDALPGAVKTVNHLRSEGVLLAILSNDGSHSAEERCRSLAKRGIEFHADEIVSSSDGLVELAADRRLKGEIFFVAGKLGQPCFAEGAGLRVTRNLSNLFDCRGVILGEEDYDWEETLNAIVNFFLSRPDGLLIVPNPDSHFMTRAGGVMMAPGAITQLLVFVLSRCGVQLTPVFLGKPHQPIFRHLHANLAARASRSLSPARVLIVGDSLEADIRGGGDFGYRTALVLTGVTSGDAVRRSEVKPSLIFEVLDDA